MDFIKSLQLLPKLAYNTAHTIKEGFNMSNLSTTNEAQQTPGQMIKAAREAKQISLSEVAQNLLLGKHTIMAIEADDYSNISAEVYAEGYLKAYAKFLQISVEEVLDSFHRLKAYSEVETREEVKNKVNHDVTWSLKNQRVLFGLLAFLILSFLVLTFVKRLSKNTDATNNAAVVTTQSLVSSGETEASSTSDNSNIDKEQLSVTTSNITGEVVEQSSTKDNS